MSEREKASLQAARAEGKIEGLKHFLDVVIIMVSDDATRDRVTNAGQELLGVFEKERTLQIDRFIAAARGDLKRGFWLRSKGEDER